ncbi:inositol-3-phosphate synthase [Streptomyces sp. SP18BB07]|uniref:inositol-3-phosphate synthase n=1 Tax=Streptomyces sp. SP18BB07 TaxID=3002522 RepID=UPI002E79E740|nr:inositol-3-phosphate synthase [Streptomyces sp. SP18BB07]MEE1766336.1 inositol-3-phosphate synthase [Streptomyces sp. SP18BB07]
MSVDDFKTAVIFAGVLGATASTTVATVMQIAVGGTPADSSTTRGALGALDLAGPANLVFGGWDLGSDDLLTVVDRHGIFPVTDDSVRAELAAIRPWPAIRTELDIPHEPAHDNIGPAGSLEEQVHRVEQDIESFKKCTGAASAVVVYLGSPHAVRATTSDVPQTWDELRRSESPVPASLIYALGAVRAGADFVDFTPGRCLEYPVLLDFATRRGVQLAGRDGSTGQTMLKMTLGDLLRSRGLRVRAWYSTNVIGNHDGYVLSLPEHAVIKFADKHDGLPTLLGYDDFDHKVTIDYVPSWGDGKESWDAVTVEGWAGSRLELRVNWRGADSMLAAPMIFDLVRLMEYGRRHGQYGLRPELGYFFKRPLLREGISPADLHREMVQHFSALAERS